MFHYQNSQLHAGSLPLGPLLAEFGSPLYVYDAVEIRARCQTLLQLFAPLNPHFHYSVKANSNLSLLRLLHQQGLGFDIVSGGELARLQAAGIDSAEVGFAGVGKTAAEIEQALHADVNFFNVESAGELAQISRLAERLNKPAQVLLRLNPNVDAKTHKFITTGKAINKFGLNFEAAAHLCDAYAANLWVRIAGFHMHIGSQIKTIGPYLTATQRMLDFIAERRAKGQSVERLNLGGGFGIDYEGEMDQAFPLSAFAAALIPLLAGQDLQIVFEPGRSLIARAGVLLTTVQYVKQSGDKSFIIVDSGMHHLIRPALYGGWHKVWPVSLTASTETMSKADVVGPICESTDFLAQDRHLPPVQPGDALAVFDVGAYGAVMASNYNTHPRPAEVLVDDQTVRLIRRRETVADLLALEHPLLGNK